MRLWAADGKADSMAVTVDGKNSDVAALEALDAWISHVQDPELSQELADMKASVEEAEGEPARTQALSAVQDAFYRDLEFGTAGLRGIIGAGTNRMNIHTVARATQGFADYLNSRFDHPSVAIARDSRRKGQLFVETAAGVLAANGVKAYVYPRIEPTPALSFAVRDLGCAGGICMTASHNPAPYNGYKAYGPDGCQITTQASRDISDAIAAVDMFDGVSIMPFPDALEAGLVEWIGEDTLDRFIDCVAAQSLEPAGALDDPSPLSVVYTPLNGTGLECVERILERVGVTDVTLVPEQAQPDGDFPTCPYPNPEIREALECGIRVCEQVHPDLLLATDPDADRVGIAVEDAGDYVLLSGNETGVLLLDYIARMRREAGCDLSRCIAVTTIVSSAMVDALAAEYGFEVRRVLTGFKYIGELIGELEEAGEQDRFIFGFEESYGYLSGPHVRDKDAVNASMLICQMARYWRSRGMNLVQALEALYDRFGFYANRTVSLTYPGADGAARMAAIMASLRSQAPFDVAGVAVAASVDYAPGYAGLPSADVVQLDLENGWKVIVRPSGTEPKIKAYLFACEPTRAEAESALDAMEACARRLLA